MESNSYDFYTKRFEAQGTSNKEQQSPAFESNHHEHTNGTGVNHVIAAQRSQPQQPSSEKTYTRTLTQLENVKTINKENYPNRFIVLEGGDECNGNNAVHLVESRVPRIHTSKSTPKRPLQCLESLAQSAGDSAAEYEAANVLLTLDKLHNSAAIRPKIRVAESRSAVEHGQQPLKAQEQSIPHPAAIMSNENDVKQQQMVENGAQPSMLHEHQTVAVVSQHAPVNAIQQNTTALTPIQPLQTIHGSPQHAQQLSTEWGMQGRVQVIQQPLQNNSYIQQLYNAQGPIFMPGNIALHPSINSQQIQVITAGKPFQGSLTTPHMLAQGKQVLQGQTGPFPGYIPTSQNQTFVFSPLSVSHLTNSQQSVLPAHSQATVSTITQPQKSADMQKAIANIGKVSPAKNAAAAVPTQCVQVSQPVLQQTSQTQLISPLQGNTQHPPLIRALLQASAHTMQFAPWQISGALPQVWAGGLQAGALSAGGLLAPSPIFIRAPHTDAPMFIQHSSQNNVQNSSANVTCQTTAKPLSKVLRQVSPIIPPAGIRPASSVSTQTANNRTMIKYRNKLDNVLRSTQTPATKQDAANQTNKIHNTSAQNRQQVAVVNSNTQTSTAQEKQQTNKSVQSSQVAIQQTQQQQTQKQQPQSTQQIVQQYPQAITTMQHATVNQTIPMAAIPQTISMVSQIHPLTNIPPVTTLVQPTTASPIAQILPAQPQTGLQATLDGTLVTMTPLVQLLSQEVSANTLAPTQLTLQGASMGLVAQPMQTVVNSSPISQPQPIVTEIKPSGRKLETSVSSPVVSEQTTTAQIAETPSTCSTNSVMSSSSSVSDTKMTTSVTFALTTPVVTVSTIKDGPKRMEISTPKSVLANAIKRKRESSPAPPKEPEAPTTKKTATSSTTTNVSTTTNPVTTASPTFDISSLSAIKTMAADTSRHATNTVPQVFPSDKSLPKAMIKPILTHVIEGYVIQEAAEPFAVNRPFRDWSADKSAQPSTSQTAASQNEPARNKIRLDLLSAAADKTSTSTEENDASRSEPDTTPLVVKIDPATLPHTSTTETEEQMDVDVDSLPNVREWTMMDVREFIRNIPGAADYADEFYNQEVDGLALLLIRPEHLVVALNIKLGPALKIVASINAIRPPPEEEPEDPE